MPKLNKFQLMMAFWLDWLIVSEPMPALPPNKIPPAETA
jgi:hypothetical protein